MLLSFEKSQIPGLLNRRKSRVTIRGPAKGQHKNFLAWAVEGAKKRGPQLFGNLLPDNPNLIILEETERRHLKKKPLGRSSGKKSTLQRKGFGEKTLFFN